MSEKVLNFGNFYLKLLFVFFISLFFVFFANTVNAKELKYGEETSIKNCNNCEKCEKNEILEVQQEATTAVTNPGLVSSKDKPANTVAEIDFRTLLVRIINWVLGFVGLCAVIMFIYGGYMYMFSAGENTDNGKKTLIYALVGMIIIILAFAIVNTVAGTVASGGDDDIAQGTQRNANVNTTEDTVNSYQ